MGANLAPGRSVSLALPASDPRSARIRGLIAELPADADVSAELRRLICLALDLAAALAPLESKLDRLLAGGLALATPVSAEGAELGAGASAEDLADLLSFAV